LIQKYSIEKTEKYYYLNLYTWNVNIIAKFLANIPRDTNFLIFPFLSVSKSKALAYLRLSDQFLVNNKSNPKLISEFLEYQFEESGFGIMENKEAYFYIKFKKVYIDFKEF
jgi:hypothetical protein